MKIFLFLPLLLLWLTLSAQQAPLYTPLSSQNLPQEVITSSTEKYRDMVAEMEAAGAKGREKKVKRQFYLETSFTIDDLLQSGLVLFSDSVDRYFHAIMTPVMKGEEAHFLGEVKFYLLRSPVVNAFASPNGMVFVSLGLLARVENEAQLAFILAHELTHITHKHALNLLLSAKGISVGSRSDELVFRSGFEADIVDQKRYNRDLEIQADEKAAHRMLASGYDITGLDQVFDLLKYSTSPYDNIPFFKSFLENEHLIFPETYFATAVSPLEGEDEDDDDEMSTHPSLGKRRNQTRSIVGAISAENSALNRKLFLVSENTFTTLREKARFELPLLFLHRHLFQEALYHAYLLLLTHENDPYARLTFGKALFGMASFMNSNNEDIDAEQADSTHASGEIQQVYFLLSKIRHDELTVLAASYLWKYYEEFPQQTQAKEMVEELLVQLKQEHQLGYGAFLATPPPAADTAGTGNNKPEGKKKKYLDFHLYAFGQSLKDPRLEALFAHADSLAKTRKERIAWYNSAEGKEESDEEEERRYKKGANLGISSLVVVNPYYLRLDTRKESAVQYVESEQGEMEFLQSIKSAAKLCKADITILDPLLMQPDEIQGFNDMVQLNDWVSEQVAFGSMPLPGYQQDRINALADRYETDYFMWTGVVAIRETKDATVMCANAMGCFTVIFAPIFIYNIFKPEYKTIYYAVLFNARTGAWQEISRVNLPNDDKRWFIHQQLYDTYNQITHK